MANDWWASKLNGTSQPASSTPVTSPNPGTVYRPAQGNAPVTYDPSTDQTVTKAISSRQAESCPNCFSGNYFAPQGTGRARCYDCGYPLLQQGSGAGMPSGSGGAATPTKQVGQSNGFNPTVIVDRIS
jgi:ribosomal protein S27AE